MCSGGLGVAGDVKLCPLTGTASADVMLEKEERPQSLAVQGRGGRNAWVPQKNPLGSPWRGFSTQLTSAALSVPSGCLGCKAKENPLIALGLDMESCNEPLPEHDTSTKGLAHHFKPHKFAQLDYRPKVAG